MPLILDNLLVFIWRWIAHFLRHVRCRNWLTVSGTIDNVDCPDDGMYPYAEIHFCYQVRQQKFDSRALRGFWYRGSAREFASRFRRLKSIKVRYCPENPSKSYVRDDDQTFR